MDATSVVIYLSGETFRSSVALLFSGFALAWLPSLGQNESRNETRLSTWVSVVDVADAVDDASLLVIVVGRRS